jgi:hypothetical protein
LSDLENAIWQPFKDQGVLVFGIHGGEQTALLEDFVEQTGVTFPIVQDSGTRGLFAYPPGSNYPYPRDVVVGRGLRIKSIKNSFNAAEMAELVEALLAEP